jgi:hypothetical protein
MAKSKPTVTVTVGVRVLTPDEYPASITAPQGAYTPEIRFAAEHPLGLYYVQHEGAGHLAAYFVRRRGSRPKNIGAASNLRGALRRISDHEDLLVNPAAPREEGKGGPVSIFSLGRRTAGAKTSSQLDREIEEVLRRAEGS